MRIDYAAMLLAAILGIVSGYYTAGFMERYTTCRVHQLTIWSK